MCRQCHATSARRAQMAINVLTLQRDCAIDEGLTPGPVLIATIAMKRSQLVTAKQALLPYAITTDGKLVLPAAL